MARGRRRGKLINGWLVIDKPADWTSTQVVSRVKRLTDAQKVGHAGTLDPLATGVLPLALGEATKTVPYVMDAAKRYRFTVRFGAQTDTDDCEGAVIAQSAGRPDNAAIDAHLRAFVGQIEQRPPAFAAVKINGERAYDIARRGEVVDMPVRTVRIDALELIERVDADHAIFEMRSGKGAYVRAIARDLGASLGCLGHVSVLRRLAVGGFRAHNACTLQTLEQAVAETRLDQVLIPLTTALADIPALAVTGSQAHRLRSGQAIKVGQSLLPDQLSDGGTIQATHEGALVALTKLVAGELDPMLVFNQQSGRH